MPMNRLVRRRGFWLSAKRVRITWRCMPFGRDQVGTASRSRRGPPLAFWSTRLFCPAAGPLQPGIVILSGEAQQVGAQRVGVGVGRVLADDGIEILQGTVIATIEQVEQRLGEGAFDAAARLQFLYFVAGHLHYAV